MQASLSENVKTFIYAFDFFFFLVIKCEIINYIF